MFVLFAILLIPVLCDICYGKVNSITWQILTLPIKFGKDVTLFCNASVVKNCCTNTATWMKDFNVIIHHGASTNSSKYSQKQRSDGFSLIIKDFDEADINHGYTCLYDFLSYSADLKIDQNNFQYNPHKDEIKAKINKTSDKVLSADIMFEKVYPPPECIFVVNKEKEKMKTYMSVEEESQTGHFYQIKLHLVCETHTNRCIDSVAVLCTIGTDKIVVYNENFNCTDINDSLGSATESMNKNILIVLIVPGLAVCAIFTIVCVLIRTKRQYSSRTIYSRIEGDGSVANLTRSDNSCIVHWRRADDYTCEESEQTLLLKSYSGCSNNTYMTWNDQRYTITMENPTDVASTSNKWTTIPAQRDEDVIKIVYHGTGHDRSYIKNFVSNFKMNIAHLRKNVLRSKVFRYLPKMPIKEDKSMTLQSYGPAQKEKDAINMVNYAKICDRDYAAKLASDALIDKARGRKTISSLKPCQSVPAAPCTNVSDVDVLKGSMGIPTWGSRKRSRISITGKQGLSNERKHL